MIQEEKIRQIIKGFQENRDNPKWVIAPGSRQPTPEQDASWIAGWKIAFDIAIWTLRGTLHEAEEQKNTNDSK